MDRRSVPKVTLNTIDTLTEFLIKGVCSITTMNCWKIVILIIYVHSSSCKTTQNIDDWWQHSVIYEIFPLSFKDSDGDGYGDFKG